MDEDDEDGMGAAAFLKKKEGAGEGRAKFLKKIEVRAAKWAYSSPFALQQELGAGYVLKIRLKLRKANKRDLSPLLVRGRIAEM